MPSYDVERLLAQRYYQPNETWIDLVTRVVNHVGQDESRDFKKRITRQLYDRIWLPNSPCLVNSGLKNSGLMACFVVGPTEDTLEHHVEVLGDIAAVGKRGGGAGFTGSAFRPESAPVSGSSHGFAYGPNNWALRVSDYLSMITQGGYREMALMYTLSSDHPDLDKFIGLKQNGNERFGYNFNQSVFARDKWMSEANGQLDRIAENAWNNGDPGLLFSDTINRETPYATCGCPEITASNPCVAEGTLVNTPFGYVPVERIRIGDFISTLGGSEPVESIEVHDDTEVFRVVFSDGGEQHVTAAHRYHVLRGSDKTIHRLRVDQMEIGDFVQVYAPELQDSGTEQEYHYGLKQGIMIGDGCYTEGVLARNVVKISTSQDDGEYNENIKHLFGVTRKPWIDKKSKSMTYSMKGGRDIVQELELKPAKAKSKNFDVTTARSKSHVLGVLDGIFVTDGNVNLKKDNPAVRWSTASVDLASSIRDMCVSLGLHARVYRGKIVPSSIDGRQIWGTDRYEILLMGVHARKYALMSRADEIHPEKGGRLKSLLTKFHLHGGTNKARVVSITKHGRSTVYDLYCAGTDTWITSGYVQQGCGEQPLPPFGSCNLGSINLSHEVFFRKGIFDFSVLESIVTDMTRFLDDVGSRNVFPNDKFKDWYDKHRPIGIGIMGFADALLNLGYAYGEQPSLNFLEQVMRTIKETSYRVSEELGRERGVPEHCRAVNRRNITTVSIAPTGSIGFIAECSHGIEPVFSPKYQRTDERGETYLFEHPSRHQSHFRSSINPVKALMPTWKQHVDIQVAAQAYTDSGVSKTINMVNGVTVDDVRDAMIYAWKSGAKGITIYRDGSRDTQVLDDLTERDALEIDCPTGICTV